MFVRDGAVTPGPSRKCDITLFAKGWPMVCATMAWQYRGSAQGAGHRTVVPAVTRMSFPRVKVPPRVQNARDKGKSLKNTWRYQKGEKPGNIRKLGQPAGFCTLFPAEYSKTAVEWRTSQIPPSIRNLLVLPLFRGVFSYFLFVFISWPRGVAENWFTKPRFWEHFVYFSQENKQNHQSSLNFLQSRPQKLTKSDFSGLAPIDWVLMTFFFRERPRGVENSGGWKTYGKFGEKNPSPKTFLDPPPTIRFPPPLSLATLCH